MGEAQSKECADEKATEKLQEAKSDFNILQRLAKTEGPKAMTEYISDMLNRWQQEHVKLAITGRSATGKSTFINAMRNVKPGDAGFAAAGSGDTTIAPTLYKHPKNDQIAFYDLPGYSTTAFKKEDYISQMKISEYHFFFIFFNNVLSEDEIWLAGELRKLNKPFSLVRSKIDIDIDNAMHDGKDQDIIIPEIKGKIKIALQANTELKDNKAFFLISSRNLELGEWSKLIEYVEANISGWKAQALLFALGAMTKDVLERKHEMLKKRLVLTCAIAAGAAALPLPGADIAVNTVLMARETSHYMHVFGIDKEKVEALQNFDHSLLKCGSMWKPNFDISSFVIMQLGKYGTLMAAESVLEMFLPFVGSIISSVTAAAVTYKYLDRTLQDAKDDAMLIYEHIMKTKADERM